MVDPIAPTTPVQPPPPTPPPPPEAPAEAAAAAPAPAMSGDALDTTGATPPAAPTDALYARYGGDGANGEAFDAAMAGTTAPAAPAAPAPADGMAKYAARNELGLAQAELDDAKGAAAKLDEELTTALDRMGPGLTEDQKKAFAEAFHADPANKAVYDEVPAAEAKLAATLQKNADVYASMVDDPVALEQLTRAYGAIANTEHYAVAQAFVNQALAPENMARLPAAWATTVQQRLANEVVAPAFARDVATRITNDEPAEQAMANAASAYDDLLARYDGDAGDAARDPADLRRMVRDARTLGKAIETGDIKAILGASKAVNQLDKLGATVAGVGLAAAAFKVPGLIEDPDVVDLLNHGGEALKDATEFGAAALQMLGLAAKNGRVATFASRAVPVLGALAAAASGWDNYQKGKLLAAAGDVLTVIGSGALLLNPLVGGILIGVGAVLNVVSAATGEGKAADNADQHGKKYERYFDQITDETWQPKLETPLDRNYAHMLAHDRGDAIKTLQDKYGYSAEDIQAVAANGHAWDVLSTGKGFEALDYMLTSIAASRGEPPSRGQLEAFLAEFDAKYPSWEAKERAFEEIGQAVDRVKGTSRRNNDGTTRADWDASKQTAQWWASQFYDAGGNRPGSTLDFLYDHLGAKPGRPAR